MRKNRIYIAISICLILIHLLVFVSCTDTTNTKTSDNRMICIEHSLNHPLPDTYVYVDTYTRVMYVSTIDGALTPLYNADGTLCLYEGEINE